MELASTAMGREAGRGLLTVANVITAVAPVAADWNDSHIEEADDTGGIVRLLTCRDRG